MEINQEFWSGKKVLITGHTGFKGSWLTMLLKELKAEIYGYSLEPPTNPSLFELANMAEILSGFQMGDIRDYDSLKSFYKLVKPDFVIHLAAQPLVRQSYVDPLETHSVNILGTANLLEIMRQFPMNLQGAILVTTDKVYMNKEMIHGYRESDRLGGFDPYSSSKAACEVIIDSYRKSFFNSDSKLRKISLISVRAGNVIGGGDFSSDRLIPDIIRAIMQSSEVSIRNPKAVRPWQFVIEPLFGYLGLLELSQENSEISEAWNFGPTIEDCIPVDEMIESFKSIFLSKSKSLDFPKISYKPDDNFHETNILRLDISKAQTKLKWRPKFNLRETLSLTLDWYLDFIDGKSIHDTTQNQVRLFMSKNKGNC